MGPLFKAAVFAMMLFASGSHAFVGAGGTITAYVFAYKEFECLANPAITPLTAVLPVFPQDDDNASPSPDTTTTSPCVSVSLPSGLSFGLFWANAVVPVANVFVGAYISTPFVEDISCSVDIYLIGGGTGKCSGNLSGNFGFTGSNGSPPQTNGDGLCEPQVITELGLSANVICRVS